VPLQVDGVAVDVIQAPKLEPRIIRYELIIKDRDQADAAEQAARRSACK
jgi:hypothetical protein